MVGLDRWFWEIEAKLSTCDYSRDCQAGMLSDGFFGEACCFVDVLNCVDAESRAKLHAAEGFCFAISTKLVVHAKKPNLCTSSQVKTTVGAS